MIGGPTPPAANLSLYSCYISMTRVNKQPRRLPKPPPSPPDVYSFPMRTASDEYAVTVELKIPSVDEECPISQESMHSYDLDFLPNVSFIPDFPLFRKLILPCNHSFSAMAITYHFFKNSMQCPLCRTGSKLPLAPLYLPEHFRVDMQAKVAAESVQVLLIPSNSSPEHKLILQTTVPGRRGARKPHGDPQPPPRRSRSRRPKRDHPFSHHLLQRPGRHALRVRLR